MSFDDRFEITEVTFARRNLDQPAIGAIRERLYALADEVGTGKLILNFAGVEQLGSAALGVFITLAKRIAQSGGQLAVCNLDPTIHQLFEITKLNRLLRIEQTGGASPRNLDDGEEEGGIPSKSRPRKPSGGASVRLPDPSAPEPPG